MSSWSNTRLLCLPSCLHTLIFLLSGIIKTVTASMVLCMMKWWSPLESVSGFANMAIFLTFSGLTFYNFLSAIFEGPGYLPLNWKPVSWLIH